MSDLTGQTVANTYKDLIQAPNSNNGVSFVGGTVLTDGLGNKLPLKFKRHTGNDGGSGDDAEIHIGTVDPGVVYEETSLIALSSNQAINITAQEEINIQSLTDTGSVIIEGTNMQLIGNGTNALMGGVVLTGLSGEGNTFLSQAQLDGIETLPVGADEASRRVIFASSLIPNSNADYDIGSPEKKVRHLYLSPNSLYFENDTSETNNVSLASVSMYSVGLSALANTRAITISPVTDGVKGESQFVASESYAFHDQPLSTEPAQFGTESLVHIAPGVQDGNQYNIHAPDFAGQTKTVVLSAVDDVFKPNIGCPSAIVSHVDGSIYSNVQFATNGSATDIVWVLECRAIQVADSLCWLMTLPNEPEHSTVAYS